MIMQILDLNNHFKECFPHGVGIMQHSTPVCGPVHPRQDPLGSHLLGLCALGRDLSHRQVGLPFDHPSSIINDISHAAIILALHSNQYIFRMPFRYAEFNPVCINHHIYHACSSSLFLCNGVSPKLRPKCYKLLVFA